MSDLLSTRVDYVVIPPDGGWGWFVVFVAFCWNLVTDCTTYTFALFLDDMLEDFSVNPSLLMMATSLQSGFYYLLGPLSAAIINRLGFRVVSITGGFLAFGGLLASAYVHNIYVFIASFGCVMGCAFSMTYLSNILVVGFYFGKYRAIATSLAVTGSAVGVSISPFIFTVALADVEWREKYKYLSGVHLLMVFFALVYKPIQVSEIIIREAGASRADASGSTMWDDTRTGKYIWDYPTNAEVLLNQDYIIVLKDADSANSESMGSYRTSRSTRPLSAMFSHPAIPSELPKYMPIKCFCCYCKCRYIVCPCLWHDHRPMYRDDILYQGSTKGLPLYNKSETDILKAEAEYHMNVTRSSRVADIPQNANCCNCCPDSVLRVIHSMLDTTLLRSPAFFLLCFSGFLTFLGFYVPYVYGIKHAIVCNVDKNQATYILTAIGVANGIGRLTFGFVPVVFPKITAMLISEVTLIFAGVAVIIHPFFDQFYVHLTCASAFGLFIATISSLRTILVVDLVGLEKLTNAFGLIVLSEGLSSMASLPLNAYLYELRNDLRIPFVFSGAVIILSGFVLIPVSRIYKWETKRKEKKQQPVNTTRARNLPNR